MEKEDNYSAPMPPNFAALDNYTIDHHHQQQHHEQSHIDDTSTADQNDDRLMVNYLLNMNSNNNNPHHHHQQQQQQLSFADVMQFADFGPKLGLNQTNKIPEEQEEDHDQPGNDMVDPVYFLKFPVLNDKNIMEDHHHSQSFNVVPLLPAGNDIVCQVKDKEIVREDQDHDDSSVQLQFLGDDLQKLNNPSSEPNNNKNNNKRKRPRTAKTSEEVESQRMTHIAVERNRRKQMNEHLRVLRSLMPGSYVQRGDQASIIGGAIEFVRELEQLLQCLESQKRRRLLGDQAPRQQVVGADPGGGGGGGVAVVPVQPNPGGPFFPPLPLPNDQTMNKFVDFETGVGLREETAENKSCLADVEVKLLGFDAMIKILSRRRPGQLIKAIAALEDLQFNILHTNITTIEQTVLYSFNVKVTSESRSTAEDIASSVQQIFNFIHANSSM
ncbi:Basic helix-loop-helix transcription factor [Parasponia andersonii]|uniref:Basic helix-loop-helix transcription factor n=1 Tax=Parasponia andersonii TaxID=3476 RepID=A0A2P5CRV2_PARAD|nr:Basic helix-loop-helix transcription factor [Parasponia andersonii]